MIALPQPEHGQSVVERVDANPWAASPGSHRSGLPVAETPALAGLHFEQVRGALPPHDQVRKIVAEVGRVSDAVLAADGTQPVANRAVVRVSAAVPHTIAVAALLAAVISGSACSSPVPNGYQPASLEPAVQAALSFWGKTDPTAHQPFYMVTPDCWPLPDQKVTGFRDPASGLCLWGMQVDRRFGGEDATFVSTRGENFYSRTSLCHEALHTIIGDDDHRDDRWGKEGDPRWPSGGQVQECKAFLGGMADIDVIEKVAQ